MLKKIDLTNIVVKGTVWFSNLAILNLFWILFSLPIITIIPATDAVFEVLTQWEENNGPTTSFKKSFKQYKSYFKKNFWKSYKRGLFYVVIAIILFVDIQFLNAQTVSSNWFQVFKYVIYVLTAIFSIMMTFGYPLSKKSNLNMLKNLLTALIMTVKYPIITLGVIGILVLFIIIFSIWPAYLFFFSFTGIAWTATKAVAMMLDKIKEEREEK